MKDDETQDQHGKDSLRSDGMSQSGAQHQPDVLPIYRILSCLPDWLTHVRNHCQNSPDEHQRAADWLLDNDYQVARAIRQVLQDLPSDYYGQLPALDAPQGARFPRSYHLARSFCETSRQTVSLDSLVAWINEFQTQTTLTNAELWSIPSMLRLAYLDALAAAFGQLNGGLELPAIAGRSLDPASAEELTDQVAHALANLAAQWSGCGCGDYQ